MGLLNLLFDLPGKIKRSVLSAQIRRNNKPTVTTYDVPVQREPMRHKKVHLGPTVQPVKPPVEIGVEPNIGQTINPNTATTVAPVEPKELTEVEGLRRQLTEQAREIERLKAMLQKSGKVGAVKASTDATKFEKQNSFARDLEQRTDGVDTNSEEYAAEKSKLLWEYGSPDDDYEDTVDPYDEMTPEEQASIDAGMIPS